MIETTILRELNTNNNFTKQVRQRNKRKNTVYKLFTAVSQNKNKL